MTRPVQIFTALILLVGLVIASTLLESGKLNKSLILGALFGAVLQRSRFCFLCHTRDFFANRDPRGVVAILLALSVGTLGYHVLMTTWLPDPASGRHPPDAHIGPVGPVLALAAFVFGIGMTISGSCISGHLYRLGEGSPTSPFALVGTVAGFAIGFLTWNPIFIASIATAPVIWLPAHSGYTAWVVIQLGAIAGLALLVARFSKLPAATGPSPDATVLHRAKQAVLINRWPATVGGAAVGVLSAVAYFQVQPLGVTAAIGSHARALLSQLGALPETLHGLDGFAGCRTAIDTGLSTNGVFVAALVVASFSTALLAGQFTPSFPTRSQIFRGLGGGVLLGWGAMTAIGCTVGTLLSGTIAGAASGWIFLVASTAGIYLTLALQHRTR